MRLLVVEDEAALCASIAEGLRLDGYEVDTCQDRLEALELCGVEPYNLILLDLNLPGLDGIWPRPGPGHRGATWRKRKDRTQL